MLVLFLRYSIRLDGTGYDTVRSRSLLLLVIPREFLVLQDVHDLNKELNRHLVSYSAGEQ